MEGPHTRPHDLVLLAVSLAFGLAVAGLGGVPAWAGLGIGGGLAVAGSLLAATAIVVGVRHGVVAALLAAGTAAAVAGSGTVLALGGEIGAIAVVAAAALGAGAALALRRGVTVHGRRWSTILLATATLVVAELAIIAELVAVPVAAEWDTWLVAGSATVLLGTALLVALGGGSTEPAGQSRESAGGMDGLVAELPDAVLRFDGSLALRSWNASAARMLGLDTTAIGARLDDLLGVSLAELPPTDGRLVSLSGSVGGLPIAVRRDASAVTVVVRDPSAMPDADRLGRELRRTIEELLEARRTIELQRSELERLATVDVDTGVTNRGSLLDRLRVDVAQARRYQHPVAVVLLDIDGFGRLNQRHGTSGGDAILREVALRVRLRVREADALGRDGSDSFLAVLPHTDEAGAATFADALRQRLAQRPITVGGVEETVTVSAGVAIMRPGEDLDADGLLARADEALASAKQAGGNRISLDRMHGFARLEDRSRRSPEGVPVDRHEGTT